MNKTNIIIARHDTGLSYKTANSTPFHPVLMSLTCGLITFCFIFHHYYNYGSQ